MTFSTSPAGTKIAENCPEQSLFTGLNQDATLADLELRLIADPTKIYPTFTPTIRLLELYFTKLAADAARAGGMAEDLVRRLPPKTATDIKLAELFLELRIRGFHPYLKAETNYTERSMNTHVARFTTMRRHAEEYGYRRNIPEQWRKLVPLGQAKRCSVFLDYFASTVGSPEDVTTEAAKKLTRELAHTKVYRYCDALNRKNMFLKLLRENGFTRQQPLAMARSKKIGVQPERMPESPIKTQTIAFRDFMIFGSSPKIGPKWEPKPWDAPSQADLKREEGKGTRRRNTAKQAIDVIALLYGFATEECELTIERLEELMDPDLIRSFKNWSFRVRLKTGDSIRNPLSILFANLKRWKEFEHVDLDWTDDVLDEIARTPAVEREQRKELVYLKQEELDGIPDKVKAERIREETRLLEAQANEARREGRRSGYRIRKAKNAIGTHMKTIFRLLLAEFVFRFLSTWSWRVSNLSSLRISGETPNLYKRAIPPRPPFEIPPKVAEKHLRDPNAEFWQVHIPPQELKSGRKNGRGFDALFSDLLVDNLEEFLTYREKILEYFKDPAPETPPVPPETLLLNDSLLPMSSASLRRLIEDTAFEFGGNPMNPHLFRDATTDYCMEHHPDKSEEVAHGMMQASDKTMKRSYGVRRIASAGANALSEMARARQYKRDKDAQARHLNAGSNGNNNRDSGA